MLKIKKSHIKEEWILYNPDSFETCHTHIKHKRVAIKIKYLVEHHILPQSHDKRFVDSMIRVTKNNRYLRQLQEYRNTL
ncbi:MAG: hypothetical protein ACERKZ_05715 [Lachnotalea sp.]